MLQFRLRWLERRATEPDDLSEIRKRLAEICLRSCIKRRRFGLRLGGIAESYVVFCHRFAGDCGLCLRDLFGGGETHTIQPAEKHPLFVVARGYVCSLHKRASKGQAKGDH
jgi:hypothetical protein